MSKFKHKESPVDGESGLFSLAQIMHLMRVEFGRSQRYSYPLACLLISIDRLAHLRELYGYESKEAVFDELVRLLRGETRSCDFLGRLMDDRLLAVVPHTRAEGVRVLAERLLRGVRGLRFETEGRPIQVTVSIGATATPGGDKLLFFDTLLATAEGALAEAAAAGGDRCVLRDPPQANG